MKLAHVLLALIAATPASAANFTTNGIASCKVYAFYTEHPDVMAGDIRLKLELVEAVAEATKLPRGSFKSDFRAACNENPNSTPEEIIMMLFDKYRAK